jgi:hypothetical protein
MDIGQAVIENYTADWRLDLTKSVRLALTNTLKFAGCASRFW